MIKQSNPVHGILSTEQAGELLGVDAIAVQRLIGIGILPDNRNAHGSVVFRDDIERYIGAGSNRLNDMPPVKDGWFIGNEGFTTRTDLIQEVKRLAESLPRVSDKAVQDAYMKDHKAKTHYFSVTPSAEMKAVYNAQQKPLFLSKRVFQNTNGQGAIATELRSVVRREVQKANMLTPFHRGGDLARLYRSPDDFRKYTKAATAMAIYNLNVRFRETREVQTIGGGSGQVEVVRTVTAESLSRGWAADLKRAMELAF